MLPHYLIALIAFAASWALIWSFKRWGVRRFLNVVLYQRLNLTFNLLTLVAALSIGRHFLKIDSKYEHYIVLSEKSLFIISLALLADRLIIWAWRRKYEQTSVKLLRSANNLISATLHVTVFGLAALMLLDSFGISVTPILASLGIGSLAIALALQETLSNFFSGIYLLIAQPFEVGQYISLDSGEEGYVDKIGWRATQIRTLPNHIVIIPNQKIANAHLFNYDIPNKEIAVLMEVGVDYRSDLKKVERVTIDVATEIMKTVQGGVVHFQPIIRYNAFAESSINFKVIMRAQNYEAQFLIKHEFVKALHERYLAEKINIPFKMVTLDLPEAVLERITAHNKAAVVGKNSQPTLS